MAALQRRWFFFALSGLIVLTRLCHTGVLWEPETFPLAAAGGMLHGHTLYRDIWYDKPPLTPLLHLLTGAHAGWLPRLLGAAYVLLCALLAFGFARNIWHEREGRWAAALMAFFLTFDFPASVVPLGPDLLTIAPHLGAVWLAWRGRSALAGLAAGVAFLANTKGIFVLLSAGIFAGFSVLPSFLAVCAACAAGLAASGAWPAYLDQVWRWSALYAASPFVPHPIVNGISRTANWLGFHSALVAGCTWRPPWRFVAWTAISAVAVALGLRFFPRYYLQLLPPLVICASYGAARLRCRDWIVPLLLLVPAARFGPRYVLMAQARPWADTAMDQDSRAVARLLRQAARPGDTLVVWGYRPELWVYSGMPDATRFLDSQPLTGVPADRHLTDSTPIDQVAPARAREELARSHPAFVADGLSLYNPLLSPEHYPELRQWWAGYHEVARTAGTVLYRRVN